MADTVSIVAPLVSIITPAFNSEHYLEETIRSVQAQTLTDWEMIISDDASTDRTLEIARGFAGEDARIRVVENSPNRHPGPTRNAAMRAASGRYIALLDSDDIWLPEKLEKQIEVLESAEKPGICYTYAEDFSDEGRLERQTHLQPLAETQEAQYREMLFYCNRACTSTFVLTREFAEEIGPFSEHPLLAGYEDWDYALRAAFRREFALVPELLARYRVHPESITRRNLGNWERHFEIYRQVEARGEMPPNLASKCQSTAWLVRGEIELGFEKSEWRSSMMRSLSYDPLNWRRWPLCFSALLPRPAMQHFYRTLKSIQNSS